MAKFKPKPAIQWSTPPITFFKKDFWTSKTFVSRYFSFYTFFIKKKFRISSGVIFSALFSLDGEKILTPEHPLSCKTLDMT